ncbi:hypothetical protein [Phaeocystidibacter luteus]|uniref:Uncharacterized protein n=1 Tax=Phaeocystidibacter luteus TaxID=911197 RepID=A0A6N6RKE4_9FLAO|nr:hypothetical protein [Phaeocystidibacter luteus]KAB2805433.1 hypothetical protein F8C67_13340 [Phaeocystidibacter luteus]
MSDLGKLLYGEEAEDKLELFKRKQAEIFSKYRSFFEHERIDPAKSYLLSWDSSGVHYKITEPLVERKMGKELEATFTEVFKST